MPDKKFFTRAQAMTVADVAALTGAVLAPGGKADAVLEDVAPLDRAGPRDLAFLDNIKYRADFRQTKAAACFVRPELAGDAPAGLNLLITAHPYRAYAQAAQAFYPEVMPKARIAAGAHVDETASIGTGCIIDDGAVIKAGVSIGDFCHIESNAIVFENVIIGAHTRIGAGAVISHAHIGQHVRIYRGVCIGQDGFGFAPGPQGHLKVPQLGRVIIEDHVEIGANACVDRGSGPDTVIGQGTWIDNLVQVGHNVRIGRGCMIAAQTGLAGSTVVDDFVAMGGQVGIAGHLKIGKGARLAAQSGIMGDVPAGAEYMGFPARPSREFLKGVAFLNRLIKKEKSS